MTTTGRKRGQHPEQGRSTVELAHVHVVHEHPTALTLTPPHAVRTETERFRQTRERLVHVLDAPCYICRVRQSDLDDPTRARDPRVNPFGATVMECHHVHIERSLANAIDRDLLAADYPSVRQYASVEEWADSEDNNAAFCFTADTPVLLACGKEIPIADVSANSMVIGHDGRPHRVLATVSREVDEELIVADGIRMTVEHPVLTPLGWRPAGTLRTGQVVRTIRMFSADVLGLAGVEPQIFDAIIRSVPVDVVNALLCGKLAPEMLLHHPAMLHLGMPTAVSVTDNALPVTATVHEDSAQSGSPRTRTAIESGQPTRIGAIPAEAMPHLIGATIEALSADRAGAQHVSAARIAPIETTAFPRASAVSSSDARGNAELCPTYAAYTGDKRQPSALLTGWRPIKHISPLAFHGRVYDIAVEGCRDFVAGGVVVHNCDACHRLAPHAVHRAGWPIVQAARYAKRDPETGLPYLFAAATPVQAQAALARDERIVADVERALDDGNPSA